MKTQTQSTVVAGGGSRWRLKQRSGWCLSREGLAADRGDGGTVVEGRAGGTGSGCKLGRHLVVVRGAQDMRCALCVFVPHWYAMRTRNTKHRPLEMETASRRQSATTRVWGSIGSAEVFSQRAQLTQRQSETCTTLDWPDTGRAWWAADGAYAGEWSALPCGSAAPPRNGTIPLQREVITHTHKVSCRNRNRQDLLTQHQGRGLWTKPNSKEDVEHPKCTQKNAVSQTNNAALTEL
jgi:LSD1 subclass zinc finger protein